MRPETKDFIDAKLRDLASEKRALQRRLEDLEATPFEPIDADAVLRQGRTALQNLPALMESGSLKERKEFVHSFVAGVTVHPDELRLDIRLQEIPPAMLPQPGRLSARTDLLSKPADHCCTK